MFLSLSFMNFKVFLVTVDICPANLIKTTGRRLPVFLPCERDTKCLESVLSHGYHDNLVILGNFRGESRKGAEKRVNS